MGDHESGGVSPTRVNEWVWVAVRVCERVYV